jgi:hypothetical protein
MIPGNGVPAASDRDEGVRIGKDSQRVRDDSQPLRDIQDIIARLEVVNKQLSYPLREMPTPVPVDSGGAEGSLGASQVLSRELSRAPWRAAAVPSLPA